MKLSSWLRQEGISDAAFGASLTPPVSQATVSRWKSGLRHPRAGSLRRIMLATGGSVTANDFLADPQPSSPRGGEPAGRPVAA